MSPFSNAIPFVLWQAGAATPTGPPQDCWRFSHVKQKQHLHHHPKTSQEWGKGKHWKEGLIPMQCCSPCDASGNVSATSVVLWQKDRAASRQESACRDVPRTETMKQLWVKWDSWLIAPRHSQHYFSFPGQATSGEAQWLRMWHLDEPHSELNSEWHHWSVIYQYWSMEIPSLSMKSLVASTYTYSWQLHAGEAGSKWHHNRWPF